MGNDPASRLSELLAGSVTTVDGAGFVKIGPTTIGTVQRFTGGTNPWYAHDIDGTPIPGTHPTKAAAQAAVLEWATSKWGNP